MLRSVKHLIGFGILARDGAIGSVYDFLVDDDVWQVKWLVVDTGKWIPGRKVLIAPHALEKPDPSHHVFPVAQTRDEVKGAPEYESDPTVPHQEKEHGWDRYYRWLPYMAPHELGLAPRGGVVIPVAFGEQRASEDVVHDRHLHSAGTMLGYRIGAQDGEIGHVEDFVLNDDGWTVDMVVVDTGHWLPGKQVVLATEWVGRVVWPKEEVEVNLSRETIRSAPEFDTSKPFDNEYKERLDSYYGRRRAAR